MDSVLKYCIGIINKQNGEITYYPKFQITGVLTPVAPPTNITITIVNGTDTVTLTCTEDNHLLNKSPYEMFGLDNLPTAVTTVFDPFKDISKFAKNVNDGFTPFCVPMQLSMNPASILTKAYLPKELILMVGITEEPRPNQKGELMCKMLLDRSVANCKIGNDQNFNSIGADTTKLKRGLKEPDEPAKVAPVASVASAAGGGGGKTAAGGTPGGTPLAPGGTGGTGSASGGTPGGTIIGVSNASGAITPAPEVSILSVSKNLSAIASTSPGGIIVGVSKNPGAITPESSGGGSTNPASIEPVVLSIPVEGTGALTTMPMATAQKDSNPTIEIEYEMFKRNMPQDSDLKKCVFVKVNPLYHDYEYYEFKNKNTSAGYEEKYVLTLYESRTNNLETQTTDFNLSQLRDNFLWITTEDYDKIVANSAENIKAFVDIDGNRIYISGDRDDSMSGATAIGRLVKPPTTEADKKDRCEYYFGKNIRFYKKGVSDDGKDEIYEGCQLFKKVKLLGGIKESFYLVYKTYNIEKDTNRKIPFYYTKEIGKQVKDKDCTDYNDIYLINPTTFLRKYLGQNPENDGSITLKGAGLKRNLATQPVMPRIYRPIQQRKTDYYNYA